MKNLIFIVGVTFTWSVVVALNSTDDGAQNKTKRGIIEQTHYYGEPVTIKYIHTPIIHHDSNTASATNFNFNNPKPIVFHNSNPPIKTVIENEQPKQVTVEQVVYEYQQTPHNAVSNVHVNQQFQTSPSVVNVQKQYLPDAVHSQTQISPYLGNQPHIIQHQEPNQYSGVASPVHHSAVIHHGQGYSKVLYDPYTVTTSAPLQHHNVNPQAKYVYANGKITYHPVSINTPYPGVVLNARPHNVAVNQNYRPTQKPFKPSPLIPITYSRHHVEPKQQVRPTEPPRKEEVEEEEEDDEKSNVREEQEEEEEAEPEEHSRYEEEEEEDFKPSYFSKYVKYDDEDEDHDRYREDEDDEDRSRSSLREVRKKPKKYVRSESKPSTRVYKNDHFKTREGFKNKKHAEYTAPSEYLRFESSGKKPKSEYKSYKYYKSSNSNSKPKNEVIESRESENIPVIHNKKIVHHEKWLVTKNTSQ